MARNSAPYMLSAILMRPAVGWLALLGSCTAYIQGSLMKLFDFAGAQTEMMHFGLVPPTLFAIAVILFELAAPASILSGLHRWLGALALAGFTLAGALAASRFRELPPGSSGPWPPTPFPSISALPAHSSSSPLTI